MNKVAGTYVSEDSQDDDEPIQTDGTGDNDIQVTDSGYQRHEKV